MVFEISNILEFKIDDIKNIYHCGISKKWAIPNTFLIVVFDLVGNRFFEEMTTVCGATGSAHINQNPNPWGKFNKHNTFQYKVITQTVFNNFKWVDLMEPYWKCMQKDTTQLDLNKIKRYFNMIIFA